MDARRLCFPAVLIVLIVLIVFPSADLRERASSPRPIFPRDFLLHGANRGFPSPQSTFGGMVFQLTIATAIKVYSAATRSNMSAQNTSGNVGLSSGEVCIPGDVGCRGDTDEALFYTFECILDILVLLVILRTLWFAVILLGRTATAIFVWARERRLAFRPGQYFQSMLLL